MKAGVKGTAFIRVLALGQNVHYLFWEGVTEDINSIYKENTRQLVNESYPQFQRVTRLYRDNDDFPGQQVLPIAPEYLTQALEGNPHFLSITSHGNYDNVCDSMLLGYRAFESLVRRCGTVRPSA